MSVPTFESQRLKVWRQYV